MCIRDSLCCVNGGVRRGNADITGAILVGLMIVPNINRTVCEQDVYKSQLLLSVAFQQLYQMADSIIVGRLPKL